MTSLAENANRDIYLDATGNLATVTGIDQTSQCCKSAVEVVLGECILDLTHGLPYDQAVWTTYLPRVFEAAARKAILAVLNVDSVVSFTLQQVGDTLTYSAVILTTFGQSVTATGVIPNV